MKILAKALRDDTQFNLAIELLAGGAGLGRIIDHPRVQKPGLALTGYVDFVQKNRVQILGSTELTYLEKLAPEARQQACDGFCAVDVAVIVCTKGMTVPPELVSACERTSTPLVSTPQTTDVFIARIESWLEDRLAPQTTMRPPHRFSNIAMLVAAFSWPT